MKAVPNEEIRREQPFMREGYFWRVDGRGCRGKEKKIACGGREYVDNIPNLGNREIGIFRENRLK